MVSRRRFSSLLATKWSCSECGSRLAPTSNCEAYAQPVNWECRSCGGIEDITHLHSNYSYYSSMNHRKAGLVMNESDMELYNRKSNTHTTNNNDRYGGGEVIT
jgi:DNA-directed RNA polymerase subunit M/transcription elongation factor TFIIS